MSTPPAQPSPAACSQATVSIWARIHAYRWLWLLALGVFGLDQATKLWIGARLAFGTYDPPQAITVIDGFFYIVHVGNTGAAWSMLAGKSGLLAAMAFFTLGGIYFWRHSLGLRQRNVQIAFGLLCGGILGNLLDRLIQGHVTDAGICTGVILYIIHSLRQPAQ